MNNDEATDVRLRRGRFSFIERYSANRTPLDTIAWAYGFLIELNLQGKVAMKVASTPYELADGQERGWPLSVCQSASKFDPRSASNVDPCAVSFRACPGSE